MNKVLGLFFHYTEKVRWKIHTEKASKECYYVLGNEIVIRNTDRRGAGGASYEAEVSIGSGSCVTSAKSANELSDTCVNECFFSEGYLFLC